MGAGPSPGVRWVVVDALLNEDVAQLVRELELLPHPEGGYYRETYRAEVVIPRTTLGPGFGGDRAVCTAIYYLLRQGDFSALHRIASDEIWHFYGGGALTVHTIHEDGRHVATKLGHRLELGEVPQHVVPAGAWFGARMEGDGDYALVGCTVAPGFDFAEFALAEREAMVRAYPEHEGVIRALTR